MHSYIKCKLKHYLSEDLFDSDFWSCIVHTGLFISYILYQEVQVKVFDLDLV